MTLYVVDDLRTSLVTSTTRVINCNVNIVMNKQKPESPTINP